MKKEMLLMLLVPNQHKENLIFFKKIIGLPRACFGVATSATNHMRKQHQTDGKRQQERTANEQPE
jgi:hypothetical protein